MLYTPVQAKDYWPLEWEKCFNMHRHLTQTGAFNYQFTLEKKMLALRDGPEYRCLLIKWGVQANARNGHREREVLLETSDPKHMESVLFVLINEAEAQAKENQRIRVRP
jgi:hypothetical protein